MKADNILIRTTEISAHSLFSSTSADCASNFENLDSFGIVDNDVDNYSCRVDTAILNFFFEYSSSRISRAVFQYDD